MNRTNLILWALKITSLLSGLVLGGPIEATYRIKVGEPVKVQMPDGTIVERDNSAYGTGTAISPQHVVTNSHVVGGKLAECTVFNAAGTSKGTVIAGDPQMDLAIIHVPAGGLSYVPIASRDPQAGDQVMIYGFGRNGVLRGQSGQVQPIRGMLGGFVQGGRLIQYGQRDGIAVIETDIAIEPGDSGSGLFNARGQLCAVQWGNKGNSHATGISHLDTLSQAWETQCGNGQCLPWRIGVGAGIGIGGGYQRPARPLVPVQPPQKQTPVQQPVQQPPVVSGELFKLAQEFDTRLKAVEGRPACTCDNKPLVAQINQQSQQINALLARLEVMSSSPGPKGEIDYDKVTAEVMKRLPPWPTYFKLQPHKKEQ